MGKAVDRNIRKGDLLDDLQVMSGYEYLSDLKGIENRNAVFAKLSTVPIADYSVRQWSAAVSYIMGEDIQLPTYDDVSGFIQNITKGVG